MNIQTYYSNAVLNDVSLWFRPSFVPAPPQLISVSRSSYSSIYIFIVICIYGVTHFLWKIPTYYMPTFLVQHSVLVNNCFFCDNSPISLTGLSATDRFHLYKVCTDVITHTVSLFHYFRFVKSEIGLIHTCLYLYMLVLLISFNTSIVRNTVRT